LQSPSQTVQGYRKQGSFARQDKATVVYRDLVRNAAANTETKGIDAENFTLEEHANNLILFATHTFVSQRQFLPKSRLRLCFKILPLRIK
jgi:hypothetical protein